MNKSLNASGNLGMFNVKRPPGRGVTVFSVSAVRKIRFLFQS
jgi:hypothetical protein